MTPKTILLQANLQRPQGWDYLMYLVLERMKKIKDSFVSDDDQDSEDGLNKLECKRIDRCQSLNIALDKMYLGSDCNPNHVPLVRAVSF